MSGPSLSLRIGVPTALFVAAVLGSALSSAAFVSNSAAVHAASQREDMAVRLSYLQGSFNTALREGRLTWLGDRITTLALDPDLVVAALLAPDRKVLGASRLALLGRPDEDFYALASLTGRPLAALVDRASAGRAPVFDLAPDGSRLAGAIAIPTDDRPDSPRPVAVLLLERDLERGRAEAIRGAMPFMVGLTSLFLLLSAAVGLAFGRRFTRRLEALLAAARRVGEGQTDVALPSDDADELGQIAAAFNRMGAALADSKRRSRESEEQYTHVFEQAGDGMFLASPEGRYLDANPAALRMVGYTIEELRQMTLADLVVAEELKTAPLRVDRVKQGETVSGRRTLRRKDGTSIAVSLTGRQLGDGRLLGVVQDRTAEVAAEHARASMAVADRMISLGTLAATVGHEINSPLTYMLGNAALAKTALSSLPESRARADALEAIDQIVLGTERVQEISADLRSVSRTKDRAMTLVDVAGLAALSERLSAPSVRARARIEISVPPGLFIRGNEGRLSQIFVNLILNAADAMPERPAAENVIRVSARRVYGEVQLQVEDNGSGMDTATQRQMFDPFFTTKPPGRGTGLGLSVARDVVAEHRGEIRVDSALGRGTTFTLSFQAAEAPAAAEPVPASPIAQPRVLLIDDDALVARSLAGMLSAFDTTVADGPVTARALIASREFDVVLCDINMPDGGAPAVIEALEALKPGLLARIAFVTGGAVDVTVGDRINRLGAPVLQKPVSGRQLQAAVLRLMGR